MSKRLSKYTIWSGAGALLLRGDRMRREAQQKNTRAHQSCGDPFARQFPEYSQEKFQLNIWR